MREIQETVEVPQVDFVDQERAVFVDPEGVDEHESFAQGYGSPRVRLSEYARGYVSPRVLLPEMFTEDEFFDPEEADMHESVGVGAFLEHVAKGDGCVSDLGSAPARSSSQPVITEVLCGGCEVMGVFAGVSAGVAALVGAAGLDPAAWADGFGNFAGEILVGAVGEEVLCDSGEVAGFFAGTPAGAACCVVGETDSAQFVDGAVVSPRVCLSEVSVVKCPRVWKPEGSVAVQGTVVVLQSFLVDQDVSESMGDGKVQHVVRANLPSSALEQSQCEHKFQRTGKGKGQHATLAKQARKVEPIFFDLVCEQLVSLTQVSRGLGIAGDAHPQVQLQAESDTAFVGDGKLGSMANLPTAVQNEEELCLSEPFGGGKVRASLPPEARGGEQLDAEDEVLQTLEELRDDVHACQLLSRKARRRHLASVRPLLSRLEALALSPAAVAVLAEIQLCVR